MMDIMLTKSDLLAIKKLVSELISDTRKSLEDSQQKRLEGSQQSLKKSLLVKITEFKDEILKEIENLRMDMTFHFWIGN